MMDLSDYTLEPLHEDDNSSCELVISARRRDMGPDAGVRVVVQDAGVDQLFEPLYTTKPDGLGLARSIRECTQRSTGRLQRVRG
jgi:C4-dicarboxylate-specific signal transduction histidine kinase